VSFPKVTQLSTLRQRHSSKLLQEHKAFQQTVRQLHLIRSDIATSLSITCSAPSVASVLLIASVGEEHVGLLFKLILLMLCIYIVQ